MVAPGARTKLRELEQGRLTQLNRPQWVGASRDGFRVETDAEVSPSGSVQLLKLIGC